MSDLEQLRSQVEAARERIGEIGESRKANDERLLGLISSLEQGLNGKQQEIDRHQQTIAGLRAEKDTLEIEMAALEAENGELKSLLGSLITVIDENSADPVAAALDALGKSVSGVPSNQEALSDAEAALETDEPIAEPTSPEKEMEGISASALDPEPEMPETADEAVQDASDDIDIALDDEPAPLADSGEAVAEPLAGSLDVDGAAEAPCSPEMAAVIDATDAVNDAARAKALAGIGDEDTGDDAAVLEEIGSEVTALADSDDPLPAIEDDLLAEDEPAAEALELSEETAQAVDALAGPEEPGELSVSEIEALLQAGAPGSDETARSGMGRPSTVKKIIERVSALAEEMTEDDPDALLKAAAALSEDARDESEEDTVPEAATGT